MRTTRKGKVAEHRFVSELLKKGYQVFLPVDDGTPIDMIAERDGEQLRIQVKYRLPRGGVLEIHNRTSNHLRTINRYYDESITLGIFDPTTERGYLVPINELGDNVSIALRVEKPKNAQVKGIRMADLFRLF